jgi:hypothetical protein
MPEALQLAGPVMPTAACFDANNARRKRSKERGQLGPPKPPAQYRFALGIHAVDLKHIFREIEADYRGGHGGQLPFRVIA